MQKILWSFLLAIAVVLPLKAELTYQGEFDPNISLEEYFDRAYPQPDKSIIYVFYNDVNMSCQNCAQTIDLIENIYNENYKNTYNLYIINYEEDQDYNFVQTYQLSKPLEVVLVRIDDGAEFGFRKLENLNYQISDPISFADNLKFQIDSYLEE